MRLSIRILVAAMTAVFAFTVVSPALADSGRGRSDRERHDRARYDREHHGRDWRDRHDHRRYSHRDRRPVYVLPPRPVYVAPPRRVYVIPQPTYAPAPISQGYSTDYCREYNGQTVVGGRLTPTYGTACLQPDGQWRIVD